MKQIKMEKYKKIEPMGLKRPLTEKSVLKKIKLIKIKIETKLY